MGGGTSGGGGGIMGGGRGRSGGGDVADGGGAGDSDESLPGYPTGWKRTSPRPRAWWWKYIEEDNDDECTSRQPSDVSRKRVASDSDGWGSKGKHIIVFRCNCSDLKAENLLLGSDGLWKLCDFGSTSTNHKRFERPEEMGIEEDNIRKHTTPAYRSPEMWDLLLREVTSEKVDIWALGCLLFRICYFKSAFDGESKLQVLNGNYRIPELPKYSSSVWFRVNGLLSDGLQKSLPDRPPEMLQADMPEGLPKSANKSSPMPRRSPPPPPTAQPVPTSRTEGTGGPIGAFWTTQHGKDSAVVEELSKVKFDEEITGAERNRSERFSLHITSPPKDETPHAPQPSQKTVQGKSGPSKDFETNFFQDGPSHAIERSKAKSNDAFNAFATEFDVNKLSPGRSNVNTVKEEQLEAEVERLKEQVKQVNLEKSELSSKYDKLSAICRSQRQELHELKQTLASRTPSPNKSVSKTQSSPGTQHQSPSQQVNFSMSCSSPC
ncbi:hypothetical protein L6452_20055 [Arctium lappa]|uniref:Uncharacterized protein n=1 Tax=Arctium lappa TaxID=4217 RepID=A0ACB9BBK7_ARCLA|nr:hypothetical protein L6452_20055 [Arctium lappa]